MENRTVICYARKDKKFREELENHLSNLRRQKVIVSWSDKEIAPGAEWEKEIGTQLNTADLILLLISSDFMNSEYCYGIEMQQAMQRHHAGQARVIPILLRAVDWKGAPFSELQMLPEDAVPVARADDRDEAWNSIVQEIRRVLDEAPQVEEERNNLRSPAIQESAKEHTEKVSNATGKPTVETPMLLALAIDVSDSMKQPIFDHTGKTIQRWTSVRNAVEHFVHLGVSWVQDPEIQEVLPLYYLMAYGFGFKELMHGMGWRKKPGGAVRNLLAHPTLTSFPSPADLNLYWDNYKRHLLSRKEYTGDIFGTTPLRQALVTIRNRIREESRKRVFTLPMLLQEKTLICARQVIWERLEPEAFNLVRTLARERFTRAVLITIVQAERKKETTVSLAEIKDLLTMKSALPISVNELPIFRSSPIGMTLTMTFNRLWRETRLPQNKGLRPVIVLVSDGQPTDTNLVDLPLLADKIKQRGIPIICCFITNRNIARPWILRNSPGLFWSEAAQLMFTISSSADEYPELAEQLKESRFVVRKQAKLFIQPNHSDYIRNFVEALLLPREKNTEMESRKSQDYRPERLLKRPGEGHPS